MRLRDGVSAGFGALAVGLSIFAIGGRPRWAQLAVALAAAAALVPLVTSRRVLGRRSPLVALALVAAGLTALQLIPLPHALLAWLNPVGVGLRDDGAALAGISPGHTISLDVPGTLDALIFFVTLLGIAVVALRNAASESGRYRVSAVVAALCGAYAIVGGVHKLFDIDKLYGVYADTGGPTLLGPLLNSNQSGCLMAIGAALSLGLAAYPRQRAAARAAWFGCALACAIAELATLSRGGALALGAGGFVTVAALLAQRLVAARSSTAGDEVLRRRRATFWASSLPIGVVAVCAVVVVLYASAGGVKDQFEHTTLDELHAPRSKYTAWRSAEALIDETPWVGVGRGAFAPVFQRVHPASAYATYTHLENEYLQAVVDWGVPGALLLGLCAAWLVIAALRRWRDGPLAAGALGALAAVLLQSNVDFGIEYLGLAAPMTAVAATLAYVPFRETTPRRLAITRGVRALHVAALAAAAALLCTSLTTTIAEDHAALVARGEAQLTPADLRDPLARHPFDYYAYALAASVKLRAGDPSAVQLLNHALTLHPTDPGLHLAAARLLLGARRPDQAAIEYAAALPAARDPARMFDEIAKRLPLELAAVAIPFDPLRLDDWGQMLDEHGHADLELAWLERFVARDPQPRACARLYSLAVKRVDTDVIAQVAQRCPELQPSQAERLALARALHDRHADDKVAQLLADVESWQGRSDEKLAAWQLLCDAQLDLASYEPARRCLLRLGGAPGVTPELTARLAESLDRIDQAQRAAAALGSAAKN